MGDLIGARSTYLFAMPSAIAGAGRLVDFGATMDVYSESKSPEEADVVAIRMDWLAVGDDLRHGVEAVATEINRSLERESFDRTR